MTKNFLNMVKDICSQIQEAQQILKFNLNLETIMPKYIKFKLLKTKDKGKVWKQPEEGKMTHCIRGNYLKNGFFLI